jgi:hypothetical protein
MIENGPIPAIHGVVRWRLVDLCQWVFEEFRIHVAPQTMSRELHAMDYRKLSAGPRHYAKADTDARRLFKAPHGMLSNLWGLPRRGSAHMWIAGASERADLLIVKCAFSHDRNSGIILPPTAIPG